MTISKTRPFNRGHSIGHDMTQRNRVFLPFLPIATEVFS